MKNNNNTKSYKKLLISLLVSGTTILSTTAIAKVSEQEANRLKGELTPLGAQKEGNADGTIPAYTGKYLGAPPGVNYKPGMHYPDPYANEKPLFVITKGNASRYADKLTDGQKALLEKYPEHYKIPVYQSHRDWRYSAFTEENTYKNALNAEVQDDQNGVKNAFGGVPFPIPKNGVEAILNHGLNQIPARIAAVYDEAAVYPGGEIAIATTHDVRYLPFWDHNSSAEEFHKNNDIAALVMIDWIFPDRKKGEFVLINEYLNYTAMPRMAWAYMPGTRRVRRAPTIGYDTPDGIGGLRCVDDHFLFNGAVDRFDWTLQGKKELYIPYNNYKIDSADIKYKDLLKDYTLNSDYMRYELHRVWVVEGSIKPNSRHVYNKRVLYIDEDSWTAAWADNYDGKNILWRSNYKTLLNAYDMPGVTGRVMVYHDLAVKAYYANNLINEQQFAPSKPEREYTKQYFTPTNMRKLGKR